MTAEAARCNLGLTADELLRLKHVTGFSKLFEGVEHRRAWETRKMVQIKRDYLNGLPPGAGA